MVINGTVSKVLYSSGNGFSVFLLRTEKGDVKCSGVTPGLHNGMCLSVEGNNKDGKYGKQFEVSQYQVVLPTQEDDVIGFLGSGLLPGLGKKNAEKLVKHFGKDIYDVLDNFPERLSEIKGLGKNKIPEIKAAWKEHRFLKDIFQFLASAQVTKLTALKIYELYGDKAIITLKKNPYILATELEGFGFMKSDKLAMGLHVKPTDPRRIDAAIQYTLMEQAEKRGDVYITSKDLYTETQRLLDFPNPDAIIERLNIQLSENNPNIATRTVDNEVVFYFRKYYNYEVMVADKINTLKRCKTSYNYMSHLVDILEAQRAAGFELSMDQLQAVDEVMNNALVCLNGGPGVGKTTIIKTLLGVFDAMKLKTDLIAPTGRAAQRMSETTGKEASTIHRYLFANGGFQDFIIPSQVVIIDESSMIDLRLMNALMKGARLGIHLIFVGDYNQLPPVGVGDVFRNMVQEPSVPTAMLSTVFRQGKDSTILKFIHSIYSGTPVITRATKAEDLNDDCVLLDYADESIRVPKLVSLYKKLQSEGEEVQVITCKREGALGVNNINLAIQEEVNPFQLGLNEFKRGNLTLREGDKVIQTKNDYDLDVFNGEIGTITHIDSSNSVIGVAFTDKEVEFSFEKARDLELAYAITVHKSQGSEFKNVIFALYCDAYYMLSTNILMTGASRAKKKLFIQGEIKAIRICMSKGSQSIRKGYIPELIKDRNADEIDLVG